MTNQILTATPKVRRTILKDVPGIDLQLDKAAEGVFSDGHERFVILDAGALFVRTLGEIQVERGGRCVAHVYAVAE